MDLCCQIRSLLFNTLSEFVIILFPRSKCLLISWLQSPSTVILEPKKISSVTVSIFSPSICREMMGLDIKIFIFWMLSFKKAFHSPLSSSSRGCLIPRCSLSAIRVVSSAYLRFLLFLPAVLILTWALSNLSFHMMHSAYKLNKQDDNTQPWHIPFPILNHSVIPYMVLTAASWPANRFLRRQISLFVIPISLRIVQFLVIDKVKDLSIVNEAEWVFFFFLEFLCLFNAPTDAGNLISGSSTFSKSSLCIWKFLVLVLFKPSLKDFEHYLASMWNECNCVVVWTLYWIALIWDWN